MSTATTSSVDVRERVEDLIRYIQSGRILDAMYEFYAPDARMQENGNRPTAGLEANVEREKQFLATVREWKGFEVKALAVDGDVSFYEASLDYVTTDGTRVHQEQVSVARWHDGRIVHERFYYDSGK